MGYHSIYYGNPEDLKTMLENLFGYDAISCYCTCHHHKTKTKKEHTHFYIETGKRSKYELTFIYDYLGLDKLGIKFAEISMEEWLFGAGCCVATTNKRH